jgi:membrane protease YdiL (CAAX protease family)
MKSFIKRHLVLTYFALTFAISWGCILIVVGTGGILGTKETVYLAGPSSLSGPSIAGILLTVLVYGRVGLRDLLSRLFRWRVGARWYAVALLTAPLLTMAILFALSLTSPVFLPAIVTTDDKASLLLSGIVAGLVVGFFEELGWTGFAMPELRKRYGILSTGLVMGLLWGVWHFPLFLGSASSSGALPPALFLAVLLFSFLPPYRMLIVWVYDRTKSLLVVMLMHAPLAAGQFILLPPAISGVPVVTYDLVFATALWVIVAAVAVAKRGQFSRKPIPRREA